MEKICRNCKFYTPNVPKTDRQQAFGTIRCESPKFKYGYGYEQIAKDEIVVENDEGWGANIGEEFGCIHFQLKQ